MEPTRFISPRWSAAVIVGDRVYVADAGAQGVSEHPLPDGIRSFPGRLLDLAARTGHAPEITIILDTLGRDGFPAELATFAERATEAGWKPAAGALELATGWITWTKPGDKGTPVVHMGIRNLMTIDPTGLLQESDDPARLADRLARYAKLTFAAYRATPGVSGLGALRNLYDSPVIKRELTMNATGSKTAGARTTYTPRPEPRFIWNATEPLTGTGDLIWRRTPTAQERRMKYAHTFDTRAAYLAAAAGARLGWHAPKHTGAIQWDPAQSGLYRIRTHNEPWCSTTTGVPIVNPNRINNGTTWVTAPVLAFLSERGYALPEIIDSWTCAGSGGRDIRDDITGPYLQIWANRLRDALPDAQTAGDPALRRSIKRTYAEAIGLLARPGGRVYRQDWAATIIDEARCRLLRKIYAYHARTGVWPLTVKTDAVTYATDDDEPTFGADIQGGPRIGQLRHDKTQTMAEYLEQSTRQAAARRQLRGGR